DDQLVFSWLLDREFARARAFENPVGECSTSLIVLLVTGPIKHQAAVPDFRRKGMHRGKPMLESQICDFLPVSEHHVVGHEDGGLCVRSFDILERWLQVLDRLQLTGKDFYTPYRSQRADTFQSGTVPRKRRIQKHRDPCRPRD